jgi:hypothetical protein
VLHIVPALFGATGIVGGAERYAFELARHMADRVPTRLVSFGPRDTATRDRQSGVLSRAMSSAGWAPVVCRNLAEFAARGSRVRAPLVIVDLAGIAPAELPQCQQLCGRLLRVQQTLLVICGHEDDPMQEIWARQIGAWLYLPGLGAEDDIGGLADEARRVVERLHPQSEPV